MTVTFQKRFFEFLNLKEGEFKIVSFSFLYFFSILGSYYVLRPLRDEMSMELGVGQLQENFLTVFLVMLGLVPLFGWLTRRFHRGVLLPWIYIFFIFNLLIFYFVFEAKGYQSALVARVFFTWVSVYNLFVVSVFWSFMADILKTEQAARLNGLISAGGTLGALVGPFITALLIEPLGAKNLILLSAGFLAFATICLKQLTGEKKELVERKVEGKLGNQEFRGQGFEGPIFSGLNEIFKSQYLSGICLFLIFYTILSTFLYGISTDLMPKAVVDPTERTKLLAQIDLAVNGVTLVTQFFIFNKIMARFGRLWGLLYLPIISAVGFLIFGWNQTLSVLIVFGVLRRSGEFSISKPTRETLFNVLPTEQKYRAKNVIDTLFHRTGDVLSVFVFGFFHDRIGGMGEIAFIAAVVSVLWIINGLWLGRRAEALLLSKNQDEKLA